METGFKINWKETCLVQNKMKCLEVDLGGKAGFAGALLGTHSLQTSHGVGGRLVRAEQTSESPDWNSVQRIVPAW